MSMTAGDLQILYHIAVEESKKAEAEKDNNNNKGADPKSAEIIEDAMRGDI